MGADDRPTVADGGPVPTSPIGDLVGTVLDGKYRITGKLGAGSMGDVYEGRQESTGRRVAIKVLKPERASREVHRHRFVREAKSALMIPHDNVVQVLEVGATDAGLLWFAMEYLQGEDLGALLRRSKRLPWDQTKEILLQVARGLQAAHARGVVHRDIKPSNILLLAGQDPPKVKIVDFGVAKLSVGQVSRVLTAADDVVGTVLYMSPEQAEGRPADIRSDIYALGVMAYETVVGRVPFPGKDIFKVMAAHMRDDPTTPAELVPELPRWASDFIMTCLRKDPEQRYPSMDMVLDVLEGRVSPEFSEPSTERNPALDAGLKTPIGEDVTRLATYPPPLTVPGEPAAPRHAPRVDSTEFEDLPTAYFRKDGPGPAAPGDPQSTPRVSPAPGGRSNMTVPMPAVQPGGPDPFSPFQSGGTPMISATDLSRADLATSGRTERMPYIPPADDDYPERSSTPTAIMIILIALALGVGIALLSVVM